MELNNVSGCRGVCTRDPRLKFWCGPTAIAAVTGCEYDQAVFRISMVRGEPMRSVTCLHELAQVLEEKGRAVKTEAVDSYRTLAEYMRNRPQSHRERVCIVRVARGKQGHFMAIAGDMVCDSAYTGGQVQPFDAAKHRGNQSITHALVIE